MCGICGKLIFKDSTPAPESIRAMCKTIMYRGPDDEGLYTAPHIGLGQRRLSVIDLAPGACPPLTNEDRTVWLVFNGEIYNFQELRKQLEKRGHRFVTNSDTEVIIHLYEDEGVVCLQKLRGMFAFALWDQRHEVLFCARDRMGKKPFCYTLTPNSFVFGSEIKAVTADSDVSVSPDYHAIDLYLTYQFVPSPLTAFKGVKRLRPGEYLTCDLQGNVKTKCYWEPPLSTKTSARQEEIEAELLRCLRESVRLRMISDVPLGAFLSGGIDSATIVALMAQESARPVKTFSIGFEEEAFNELPYARLLAERYGTEHHELIVKPNVSEVLPLLVRHYNEPFADPSALPTYYVSKMTRRYVTVALSGDGGDESFAGYDNYTSILGWNKWDMWPLWLRKMLAEGGRGLLNSFPHNNNAARLRRGLAMLGAANVKVRRLQFGTTLKPEEKRLAYTPSFRDLISRPPVPEDPLTTYPWEDGMDELDWLMRHDQNFYLPDCLMVKTDIASMANSLEVRCPFLDHELVEFAATIPSRLKRDSSGGKLIMKNALTGLIPEQILHKKKMGFDPPLAEWFRTDLTELLRSTLLDCQSAKRCLFHPRFLQKLVQEHTERKRDWSNRLWVFLFLELWFREYID
ncbi:MAG: asparagine synthase (glutamine-hydrolyzing) [Kiritimatiellae bacterium]|nr:asparagine synthase (glutamine-hydrolyzing) [Kiritimatiellia bacterium]MDD5521806.1 asparagine synthase (glutamine-hydrolyzing) [Kiritimatiellia bacterium]